MAEMGTAHRGTDNPMEPKIRCTISLASIIAKAMPFIGLSNIHYITDR